MRAQWAHTSSLRTPRQDQQGLREGTERRLSIPDRFPVLKVLAASTPKKKALTVDRVQPIAEDPGARATVAQSARWALALIVGSSGSCVVNEPRDTPHF